MLVLIKINEAEALNINSIQSFTASEWEKPQQIPEPCGSANGSRNHQAAERETVLTIIRKDGTQITLCGLSADAALEILHQHGF